MENIAFDSHKRYTLFTWLPSARLVAFTRAFYKADVAIRMSCLHPDG